MVKKRTLEPRLYRSPIALPEARSGSVSIVHRQIIGDVSLIGIRQAFLRGVSAVVVTLPEPVRVHELRDDKRGVWMSDSPEELNQIGEMISTVRPRGDVLVGGLGLGIVATSVASLPLVNSVTVIEINPHVVRLVHDPNRDAYRVVTSDLLKWLQDPATRPYDYYLLDTWQGTGEADWWEEVVPLRRAIRKRHGSAPVIHCWAEDIMLGQVEQAVGRGASHWYYSILGKHRPQTAQAIRAFTRSVGLAGWERRYGAALDAFEASQRTEDEGD